MLVTTLVLGGVLHYFETETFPDAFESMWAVLWLGMTCCCRDLNPRQTVAN